MDGLSRGYNVYNLGGTNPVLLCDLVAAIGRACGQQVQIDRQPWQPGDVPITCADVSRAADDLGYAPKVDLETGLAAFVAWYRQTFDLSA